MYHIIQTDDIKMDDIIYKLIIECKNGDKRVFATRFYTTWQDICVSLSRMDEVVSLCPIIEKDDTIEDNGYGTWL